MFFNPRLHAAAFAQRRHWLSNVSDYFSIATLITVLGAASRYPFRCLSSTVFERTEVLFSFGQGVKGFGSNLGVGGRTNPWGSIISAGRIRVDTTIGGLHPKRGRLRLMLIF